MKSSEVNDYIRENYKLFSDKQLAEKLTAMGYPINDGSVRKRRRSMDLVKDSTSGTQTGIENDIAIQLAHKIAQAMRDDGTDPREVGKIRISRWQQGIKNADGEFEAHNLEGFNLVLDPGWATGPQWPVVQPATPVKLTPVKSTSSKTKFKTAVILPDPQIGFMRDLRTGELSPFHDEAAMQCALRMIKDINPDLIINLGDFLDFATFGSFIQEAGFALTTQAAINRGYLFLAEQKQNAPNAHVVLLAGNHDQRLQKSITTNAVAAFGLHRAELPEEWPVLSVPFLLRTDELGVEYLGGYPANAYYINDRLKCVHGHKVRSATSTARAVIDDERVSTIFGHVHRIEVQYKTVHVRDGARISLAMTPGCLCRIDGAVPSTKSGIDPFGKPLVSYENWQQGLAVVHYEEGEGQFAVTPVFIFEGQAIYNGVVV